MTEPAPFIPEVDARFKKLENGTALTLASGKIFVGNGSGKATAVVMSGDGTLSNTGVLSLTNPNTDGTLVKHVARFLWDFSVNGGASTGIALDATLPAKAIVTRNYFYVVTQLAPSGTTASVACASGNLLTAADESGVAAGSALEGQVTGAASTFQKVGTNSCTPTITFGVHAATAGKILGWAEYEVYQ